eukprot:TRINITY_DN33401_c0_g1_i1.p1 TRINITY_DN33401_c0_g1~~TRINITY_DN33401_c0_g1_i1.p1  ORF type:complete len:233 (-),score=61.33 TRINITY_DN33401_c0_g1_i1:20-718(-)
MSEGENKHRKLIVLGLSWDTTSETLKTYFETFGNVIEGVVLMDRNTGRSRGFGFVTFDRDEDASTCLAQAKHVIDGREVSPKKAAMKDQMGDPRLTTKKIFVGRLHADCTTDALAAYFGKFGTVTDTFIPMNGDSGRTRGFGFVTFEKESSVDDVLAETHKLDGHDIFVTKAEPKQPYFSTNPMLVPIIPGRGRGFFVSPAAMMAGRGFARGRGRGRGGRGRGGRGEQWGDA